MFKKIILTFILGANVAHAQIGHQILKQIEKVNNKEVGVSKVPDPCDTCAAAKSAATLFAMCVETVCNSKGLRSYTEIPALSYADLQKPAPDEKELEALFAEFSNIKDPLISEADKIIGALQGGKLDPSKDTLQMTMQFLSATIGAQVMKVDPATFKFSVDEDKWKGLNLSSLSEKNKKALHEHVKVFLTTLNDSFALFSLESSDSYLKVRYPTLPKVDAVKKMIADFKNEFEQFKGSSFGLALGQITNADAFFPIEIVSDIESGKDVTEMALNELIKARNNFSSLQVVFDSKKYSAASDSIDYDDLKKQLLNTTNINETVSDLKKAGEKKKKENEQRVTSCMSIYRRNILTLPTKSQIKNLSNEIDKIKQDIQAKWIPLYSTETQKKIREYLAKVRFHLPGSKEDYQMGFKQRIHRELQMKKREGEAKIKDTASLASFLALIQLADNFAPANANNKSTEFCEGDKISPLNDANFTLQGKIQVSYTSAHAPEMGRGVVAHEIGHGISQLFRSNSASEESAKKHKVFTDCLASLHDKKGEQYVEEDYADFVAANLTNVNKACLYPLNIFPSAPAIENESLQDPHSSNFFRLMHIESIQRKKLPEECNQLLVEQRTPKDFLLCQKLIIK